ncbi:hypothetical protein KVV02_003192 [Mortierella alpina]|uniref:Uncharacterized protein n=1 Tax=Mortierella alpina TaxID=64518 RepID=A0A9P8A4U2_MORAP|nr:hypothetical protein KVV02_003192 [Mortierella alpina]
MALLTRLLALELSAVLSLRAVIAFAMSEGKYHIQVAADPKPFIGMDSSPAPLKPVVTDGSDNLWTVKQLPDGSITIAVGDSGHQGFVQLDEGGNLVVSDEATPFAWSVKLAEGDTYTIEFPNHIRPTRGWSIKNSEPKSAVILRTFDIPMPEQLWEFIPVEE